MILSIVLLTFCLTSFSQNYSPSLSLNYPPSFSLFYNMVLTYHFSETYIFTTMYTIDSNIDLICSLNHLHSTPYFLPFKSFFTSSKRCKVLVKQKRTIYTSHLFSYIIGIFIDLLLKLSGDIESNHGPTQCGVL